MNEQQRREQIAKMRLQQEQQRQSSHATLSDAEAERMVREQQGLTQEQLIATAMLGKFVQNDITTIKKASLGDLKVSDVDMSKVMPSGIAKAMGRPLANHPQISRQIPPPPVEVPPIPGSFPPVNINPIVPPAQMAMMLPPQSDPNQMELDFNRRTRYEDIEEKLQVLENKVIALNEKLDIILELLKKS